jgi:hypothetical protein
MDESSKLLEDMIVSQPQLPAAYNKLTLNPPVVDGMINLTPLSVNPVDHVVNLVTSLVEPVEKVVDPIPSLVDPTLQLESETQAVDPFPPADPILPLDIGGHPPFPTGSKQRSDIFGNLLFLVVFRVLNFWSRFEALNDVFWGDIQKPNPRR